MAQAQYYGTEVMLEGVKVIAKATTFLRDRYFPQAQYSKFLTNEVIIEEEREEAGIAPFVVPYIGGVPVAREGYTIKKYEPANIEPKIPMTIGDLEKKGFEEDAFNQLTPQQRAAELLAKDFKKLDKMIARTEELMAAKIMLDNAIDIEAKTGKDSKPKQYRMQFYEGTNPNTYAITKKWGTTGSDWKQDITNMCLEGQKNGVIFEDLIVTPSVYKQMLADDTYLKMLDNRNFNIGNINPTGINQETGAVFLGKLIVYGFTLNLISYNQAYKDGTVKQYIPDGTIILAVPGAGQRVYGAVTQMENGEFKTYAGDRVPQEFHRDEAATKELKMTAKPFLAPRIFNGFMSAQAVTVA